MSKLANVLIIADQPEFTRAVMTRWQGERHVPTFTLLGGEMWDGASTVPADLAVVGPLPRPSFEAVLRSLEFSETATVCVSGDVGTLTRARSLYPRALVLNQREDWIDVLVQLCGEILHRVAAEQRACRVEQISAQEQLFVTLGRYIVEMRHGINNIMTSLMGNAELLLLEPASLSPQLREQLDTIHSMSQRLNQIMQRFTSLESEMLIVERYTAKKPPAEAPVPGLGVSIQH